MSILFMIKKDAMIVFLRLDFLSVAVGFPIRLGQLGLDHGLPRHPQFAGFAIQRVNHP
jgi:hypothetical protein